MEQCPVDHKALLGQMWKMHGKAQAELRGITEDGADILTENMTQELAQDSDAVLQAVAAHPVSPIVPYGDLEKVLPPDIFGTIESAKYTLPKTRLGQWLLHRRYMQHDKRFEQDSEDEALKYKFHYNSSVWETIPEVLRAAKRANITLDEEKWSLQHEAAELQKTQGTYYLEYVHGFRKQSTSTLYNSAIGEYMMRIACAKFDYFKSTVQHLSREYQTPSDFVIMPVGGYGKQFTQKLVHSVVYTSNVADRCLSKWSAEQSQEHENVMDHMARVRSGNTDSQKNGTLQSMQEGALSIAQTIALLTAERIPGFASGEELLQEIVSQGLVEEFARSVPIALIGPIINEGRYIPGLLEVEGERLQLNPYMLDALKALKRWQLEYVATAWATYNAMESPSIDDLPAAFGLICPAAMPHGAIERMLKPMAQAIQLMDYDKHATPIDIQKMY